MEFARKFIFKVVKDNSNTEQSALTINIVIDIIRLFHVLQNIFYHYPT